MPRLVLLLLFCLGATAAYGADISARSSCTTLLRHLPASEPRQAERLAPIIVGIMLDIEAGVIGQSKRSLLADLTEEGQVGLAASTAETCRRHRRWNVRKAASESYRALRSAAVAAGVLPD